jgi:hypothetical protein
VLHGVEVEGVAVAGEGDVKVTRDYFAWQHEVGVGDMRSVHVTEIALNLFYFLPGVATAQALPVIGRGLQHGGCGFPIDG